MTTWLITWIDEDQHPVSRKVEGNIDDNVNLEINLPLPLESGSKVKVQSMDKSAKARDLLIDTAYVGEVVQKAPVIVSLEEIEKNDESTLQNLIQRRVPDANAFLSDYNKGAADRFFERTNEFDIITQLGGVIHRERVEIPKRDRYILHLPRNSVTRNHLRFSKNALIIPRNTTSNEQLEIVIDSIEDPSDKNITKANFTPNRYLYRHSTPLETHNFEGGTQSSIKNVIRDLWLKFNFVFTAIRGQQYFITLLSIIFASILMIQSDIVIDPVLTGLIIIGTFSIQGGGNLLNDYFDHKSELDDINVLDISHKIHGKFIQKRMILPSIVLGAGIVLLSIGAIIGLYLNYASPGNIILWLGLFGAVTTYYYTAEPIKLAYRGIGEIVLGLNFGPLIIIGTTIVLSNSIQLFSDLLIFTIPSLLFVTGLLILNEINDIEADKLVGKQTTAVRLGRRLSMILVIVLALTGYLLPSMIYGMENLMMIFVGLLLILISIGGSIYRPWFDNTASPVPELYALVYPIWIITVII